MIESADPSLFSLGLLSDDAIYDLYIAQDPPVNYSILGKDNIYTYLAILPKTYEPVRVEWRDFFAAGDRVIVAGCECAYVARLQQVVDTEWTCVFQFNGLEVQRISMSIYRGRVRPYDEWTRVDSAQKNVADKGRAAWANRGSLRLLLTPDQPDFHPCCSTCLGAHADAIGAESAAPG
jgi:hypothetical protein